MKNFSDYNPRYLLHVKRNHFGEVDVSTLEKGDVLIAQESGCTDLVEVNVVRRGDDGKVEMIGLLYHTSYGKEVQDPIPFEYDATESAKLGLTLSILPKSLFSKKTSVELD